MATHSTPWKQSPFTVDSYREILFEENNQNRMMTLEIFADFCRYLLFFIFPGKISRCSLFKNKLTPVHPRVVSNGFYKTRHEMRSFCETPRDVLRLSGAMESGNSSNTNAPSHGDGEEISTKYSPDFLAPAQEGIPTTPAC